MKQTALKSTLLFSAALAAVALGASARQPERGYRGFVDWTNRYARHSDGYWNYTNYYTGFSTTHGYQFNPWLFLGTGIDFEMDDFDIRHQNFNNYKLSLFLQGRTDLKFGIFTPFADIRIGYNANSSENGNIYLSPSIGYRFNWGRKVGINVGIGYTLDGSRYEEHIWGQTPEGLHILVPTGIFRQWNQSYFSFRVGIDF